MTLLIMGLMLVVAALAQAMMPGLVVLGQARFPWLLAVTVYYAWNRELHVALVAGFFAGFLQDVLSPFMPLGYSVGCFCATAFAVNAWSRFVDSQDRVALFLTAACVGAVVTLVFFLLLSNHGVLEYRASRLFVKMLGSAVLAGVCSLVANHVLRILDRLAGNAMEGDALEDVF